MKERNEHGNKVVSGKEKSLGAITHGAQHNNSLTFRAEGAERCRNLPENSHVIPDPILLIRTQ